MTKPLKLVQTTDSVAALLALGEVLEGRIAAHFCDSAHQDLPAEVGDNVGLLVESSGSTGRPRMYELSPEALLASARATEQALGGPGQWLLCLPINYIAGIQVLVRSLIADTQPVLTNTSLKFTAEGFARAASMMKGERRYTSLVPTQLNRLAAVARTDEFVLQQMRSFDAILIGGQAPSPNLVAFVRSLGVNLVVTYGSTETAGGCVYDGVPLDGVGVELEDDGLIAITGPTLANGLDGRWISRDLGEFDADGKLQVIGRADRVINSGGIKLSLDWVEQWVSAHEQVKDVVVVPLNHPEFGESFLAYVVYANDEVPRIDADNAENQFGIAAKAAVWAELAEIPLLPNGKPNVQLLIQNFMEFQEQMRQQNG